jgi:hypothetical protein
MSNAGAIATMSPCSGGPGTRITIKLNRNLNAPLKEITFRPYQVTGIPGGVGALVLAPVSGNSKTAGSYYEVTVPQQLCVGKGGSWDLFPTDTSNQGQGDIGRFTVQCGAGAVAGGSGAPAPTTLAPPPPPSPAPFKPCYVNSGSVAAISPCTTIRPGDIVTIQVLQALKSPIKTVVFKPRQLSLPSATGVDVQVTMTSSATNVGGTYNFPLPQQICLSGRGSWDAWPVDGNGKGLGDIGQVNVVCQ